MTVADITVQPTEDPNTKAYHTRFEMASGPEKGSRGNADELGEFGHLILEVRGIATVFVCPYVLLVSKAQMFEWAEIDPKVVALLKVFAESQRLLDDEYTIESLDRIQGPRLVGARIRRKAKDVGRDLPS